MDDDEFGEDTQELQIMRHGPMFPAVIDVDLAAFNAQEDAHSRELLAGPSPLPRVTE